MKEHAQRNRKQIAKIETLLGDSRPVSITGNRRFRVVYRCKWMRTNESRIVKADTEEDAGQAIKYDVGECRIVRVEDLT